VKDPALVLTPSSPAHGIVQKKGEGKDDGAGTKWHQPGRETLDGQEKSGPCPGPDQGDYHRRPGGPDYDLTPAEIEECLEEGLRGMENNLRSRPKDVAEQYESQIKDLQAKVGELVLEVDVLKKAKRLFGQTPKA